LKKVRHYIFLRDVLILSLTSFGGPQAHFAFFLDKFVKLRGYLNEEELVELFALCNILPGPTSTQTVTSIGFRIGGPNLAYLTLLVWITPAVTVMLLAGIFLNHYVEKNASLEFARFIQPMAVGFVSYAAFVISRKVVITNTAVILCVISAIISFSLRKPYIFPILLLMGGFITGFKYRKHPIEEKSPVRIQWANFLLWGGVLLFAALLGGITRERSILLFENFYRNGSLIFGGGQVLIPYLYTEFVQFKHYLTAQEFLSGYAIAQAIPGPVFSFSAFVGTLSMRDLGVGGEIFGGLMAAFGIFLPGTFLIFFVIRFWEDLKKYRVVRASLEGINAASAGMVISAALILFFQPFNAAFTTPDWVEVLRQLFLLLWNSPVYLGLVLLTFLILRYTKIPAPYIIISGLIAGFLF
jgi:chromate transporter